MPQKREATTAATAATTTTMPPPPIQRQQRQQQQQQRNPPTPTFSVSHPVTFFTQQDLINKTMLTHDVLDNTRWMHESHDRSLNSLLSGNNTIQKDSYKCIQCRRSMTKPIKSNVRSHPYVVYDRQLINYLKYKKYI